MIIKALQKFSLLDFPDKICAIVFTKGCNFRCPFCHNSDWVWNLSDNECFDEKEVYEFLSHRKGRLDGVCVTGGEPLMQNDLPQFLQTIRQMGFLVKLDTNGSYPERLEFLMKERLVDYVAMDIKNSPEKYSQTVGKSSFELAPIQKSADLLLTGEIPYEFRTTVMRDFHNNEDIHKIGQWLKNGMRYCLQNVQNKDVSDNSQKFQSFSAEEMVEMKNIAQHYFQRVEIR